MVLIRWIKSWRRKTMRRREGMVGGPADAGTVLVDGEGWGIWEKVS